MALILPIVPPATYERTFRLSKQDGAVAIIDRLDGRGAHDVRRRLHLAPCVEAEMVDASTVRLSAGGREWWQRVPRGLVSRISGAEYSPPYSVTQPCLAIDAHVRIPLEGTQAREWCITA